MLLSLTRELSTEPMPPNQWRCVTINSGGRTHACTLTGAHHASVRAHTRVRMCMHACTHDGPQDRRAGRRTDGRTHAHTVTRAHTGAHTGFLDGWTDGRTDRRTDGQEHQWAMEWVKLYTSHKEKKRRLKQARRHPRHRHRLAYMYI